MGRATFTFIDIADFVSVEAEEIHEDGEFIKAYNNHNELVAMFRTEIIRGAYITIPKTERGST